MGNVILGDRKIISQIFYFNNIMKRLILSSSILIALCPIYAQANDVQTCLAIADNTARLACYDKLHAPTTATPNASDSALKTPVEVTSTSRSVLDLDKTISNSIETRSPQVVLVSEPAVNNTPLTQLYDLDENSESGLLTVREHEPMYLMPAWYNTSPNRYPYTTTRGYANNDVQANQKHLEAKMQVSFKTKLMQDLFKTRADLWFGYTQQSNWQVYNQGDDSAPFRNNDYAPEFFLTQPVKSDLPWGGKLRMLGAGYIHQSNGQSRPLSRSWNRAYIMAGMEWGKLTVVPRLWMRLDKKDEKDDNPDIGQYMGYGDLKIAYKYDDKHTFYSLLRYNPKHNRGAIQLNYMFPIKGKLKGLVQGFHGYGENLLDYNHKQTGIGVGLVFQGWDGL